VFTKQTLPKNAVFLIFFLNKDVRVCRHITILAQNAGFWCTLINNTRDVLWAKLWSGTKSLPFALPFSSAIFVGQQFFAFKKTWRLRSRWAQKRKCPCPGIKYSLMMFQNLSILTSCSETPKSQI